MRPLRAYLLALVIGATLPLFVLATAQALGHAARQRAAVEAGLVDTSRNLATAVEHELQRSVAALNVLAASPNLDRGDLTGFYEEAAASMGHMPWFTVWLADAHGRQLANLLAPLGTALPSVGDRAYAQDALRSGKPTVSGILVAPDAGRPGVAVVVPRVRGGRTTHLIGAALPPGAFEGLLASVNRRHASATASITGPDFLIIARNRDGARWTGQRAHQDYIERVSGSPEGLTRMTTLEGDTVYAAYRRLPTSEWVVGLGVQASDVEGPMREALWASALIGLSGVGLAVSVAVLLSRRITRPIKALASTAESIAVGRDAPLPEPSNIEEIATLARALQFAAEATRERDQLAEHARRIAAELEAAETRERQQIARDLHDELAQTLAAALIRLAPLQAHADSEVRRIAGDLASLVQRANRSTRSLAEQLSPPVLSELGLVPALEWLGQQLAQDYDLQVTVHDDGRPKPLLAETASTVFRCVRELLINVAKHAQTHRASVTVRVEEGATLAILVRDAGRGLGAARPAPATGGRLGLLAVKERVAHLGGTFMIRSQRDGGTEASLRLPLQPSDAVASTVASA